MSGWIFYDLLEATKAMCSDFYDSQKKREAQGLAVARCVKVSWAEQGTLSLALVSLRLLCEGII
jgi:hypothetical protein